MNAKRNTEDTNSWLKKYSSYLVLGGVAVAIGILALAVSSLDTNTKPQKVSTAAPHGGVTLQKFTGIHKGKFYGQTMLFKIPKQVHGLKAVSTGDDAEQVTFVFDHGNGSITSSPVSGAKVIVPVDSSGQKVTHLLVAKHRGTMLQNTENGSQLITVIGHSGAENYNIQLSQIRSGSIKNLAEQLSASLRSR